MKLKIQLNSMLICFIFSSMILGQDKDVFNLKNQVVEVNEKRVYQKKHKIIFAGEGGTFLLKANKTTGAKLEVNSESEIVLKDGFQVQEGAYFKGLTSSLGEIKSDELNSNSDKDADSFKAFNYPNPFNPKTTISYNLLASQYVTINVYNSLGQKVKTLVNDFKLKGLNQVTWNADNESGNKVSTGIYFYQIRSNGINITKKMILLK
jgi:hypothetical protein